MLLQHLLFHFHLPLHKHSVFDCCFCCCNNQEHLYSHLVKPIWFYICPTIIEPTRNIYLICNCYTVPRTFDLTHFNGMFTRAEVGHRSVMTQRTVVRGPVYTIPKTTIFVNSTFIWRPVCGSAVIRHNIHFHLLTIILLSHARACVFVWVYPSLYVCMYVCIHYMYACLFCVYICVYACMNTCMCIYV